MSHSPFTHDGFLVKKCEYFPATMVYHQIMTRPYFLGLLAGTVLTGILVGRWWRGRAEPAAVAGPSVMVVQVAQADSATPGRTEERDWLGRISAAEDSASFAQLWAELERSRLPRPWVSLMQDWLMGRWVATDLKGCLAHCQSTPNVSRPGVPWVGLALTAWARVDATAALTKAQEIDAALPAELRLHVRELSVHLAELDPGGFIANKYHLPKELYRAERAHALETLGRRSPQEAVAAAGRYLEVDRSGSSLGNAAGVIAAAAAQQMGDGPALAWARSLEQLTNRDRQRLAAEILNKLAVSNPATALAEAAHWDWEKQGVLPWEIWPLLARQNPGQALAWASQHDPTALRRIAGTLAPDASTLATVLASQRNENSEQQVISPNCLVKTLQGLSPERCRTLMEEAHTLPPGKERDQIYEASLQAWAGQQPAEAISHAMNLTDPAERQRASLALVQHMTKADGPKGDHLPNLLKLIDVALPYQPLEGTQPDLTVGQEFLTTASQESPEEVWDWLQDQPDFLRYDAWTPTVLGGMAAVQPATAVEKVLAVNVPQVRQEAMTAVVSQWAEYDPHATSVWARSLPRGPDRELASLVLAQRIAGVEPSSAYPWALDASPGEDRQHVLSRIFEQWEADEPGVAMVAMQYTQGDDALLLDLKTAWEAAKR